MEPNTKAIGSKTKQTEKVNFGMRTVMSTKANGRTIKPMATEFISM